MADCNHVVHISHALQNGMKSIKVRSVDTDVVTILVGAFHELTEIQPQADIWVAFGMGRNYCYYYINPRRAKIPRSTSISCTDRL